MEISKFGLILEETYKGFLKNIRFDLGKQHGQLSL